MTVGRRPSTKNPTSSARATTDGRITDAEPSPAMAYPVIVMNTSTEGATTPVAIVVQPARPASAPAERYSRTM